MGNNDKLIIKANNRIEEMKGLANKDYYRLKYHIMPPTGLLNDPNGFIYINNEYHLFYQFHPFDTKHGLKYWAHLKSKNLVDWETLPIALAPSQWYETHGCYSGSSVNNNGSFTLIYTGNVKDKKGNRETYQCLASTKDGVNFIKYKNNPVINNQPKGYTRHFRDPKVWFKGNYWHMVIGAQTINREGRVLLFRSSNLKKWDIIGEVAGSNLNNLNDFGYMWECPDIFSLNNKDVLIVCPQGLSSQGDLYNNIYQSGYFIGKLNYNTGSLNHGEFTELDRGFEFYAPQTTIDNRGRRILIGWMGLPEEEDHPTIKYGWIHAMTIPRVLKLINNKVYQSPIEELKNLRKKEISYRDIIINNEEIDLDNIEGDVFELYVVFENINASKFGIKIRCSYEEQEYTLLYCNNNKFIFDRNNSGKGYGGVRRCSLSNSKKLKLNIFSDTSSLEIFVNDGEEVLSGRIYPNKNSRNIKFFSSDGKAKINKIKKWRMKKN